MRLSLRVTSKTLDAPVSDLPKFRAPASQDFSVAAATLPPTRRITARVNERVASPGTGVGSLYISPHEYLGDPTYMYDTHRTLHILPGVHNVLGHGLLGFPTPMIPYVASGSQDPTVEIDSNGMFLRPGATTPAPTVVIPTHHIPQYLSPLDGLPYDLYIANFAVIFQLYEAVTIPVHATIDPSRIALLGHGYGATVAFEALSAQSFKCAALHQGIYYWPALVGSLEYNPNGGLISDQSPALLEASSAILLATSAQLLYLSAEGAPTYPTSGPPWISDTITAQLHAWHSYALRDRLLALGNVTLTVKNSWSPQSIFNWIVANV